MGKKFNYPIFLDLSAQPVLVVGAGQVGLRKIKRLLESGAHITVMDPEPISEFHKLYAESADQIKWISQAYASQDLTAYRLVFAATTDPATQTLLAEQAHQQNVLINVVNELEACDFTVPAIYQQNDLWMAISTQGNFPGFSKYLRQKLEKEWGDAYASFLNIAQAYRQKLISENYSEQQKNEFWKHVFASNPIEKLEQGFEKELVQEMEQCLSIVMD